MNQVSGEERKIRSHQRTGWWPGNARVRWFSDWSFTMVNLYEQIRERMTRKERSLLRCDCLCRVLQINNLPIAEMVVPRVDRLRVWHHDYAWTRFSGRLSNYRSCASSFRWSTPVTAMTGDDLAQGVRGCVLKKRTHLIIVNIRCWKSRKLRPIQVLMVPPM